MNRLLLWIAPAMGAALLAALPAVAFAERDLRAATAELPLWRAECGSCHVAYPPRLLSRPDWQAVMAGLDRHYGTDASLPPESVAAIALFLDRNAGGQRVASPTTPPQVTTTPWFKREHREIAPATWSRAAIGSPANCGACHAAADAGRFDEHSVRIPR